MMCLFLACPLAVGLLHSFYEPFYWVTKSSKIIFGVVLFCFHKLQLQLGPFFLKASVWGLPTYTLVDIFYPKIAELA